MSILSVHDIQGISAYSNTIRVPSGHNLETFGKLTANGTLKVPVWTTETRPSSPEIGLIGFNDSTGVKTLELYNGTAWVTLGSVAKPNLPTGYSIAMTMDSSNGGRLSASTWTISEPSGTAATYVSSGGVGNSGYYSNSGRPPGGTPGVSNYYYRINEMPIAGTTDLSFCIWYKGAQNIAPQTYGPAVPLFGDTRGSVYGGFGISNGLVEFRDSGNAYQGPSIINDQWRSIVFTLTAANTLKIYVDGTLTNTYNSISIQEAYTRCSDIGAHYPYAGYVAPSAIDSVVVYSRILTDAEVTQVYQAQNFTQ